MEPIYGSTVFRCTLDRPTNGLGRSVIVKRGRAPGEHRSDGAMMRTEIAARRFLAANRLALSPEFIASDADERLVIVEDLGNGPSLEDLLFGGDRRAVVDGLIASGQRPTRSSRLSRRQGSAQSAWEPVGAFGLSSSWLMLRSSVEAHPNLPQALGVEHDIKCHVGSPCAY
jgi:hypothetical protein